MGKKWIRFCFIRRICTIRDAPPSFFSLKQPNLCYNNCASIFFPGFNNGLSAFTASALTFTSQYYCENSGHKFSGPNIFLSAFQSVTWILTPTQSLFLCAEKGLKYQMRALVRALLFALPNCCIVLPSFPPYYQKRTKYPIHIAEFFTYPGTLDVHVEVL